jgi:hypothetical protein
MRTILSFMANRVSNGHFFFFLKVQVEDHHFINLLIEENSESFAYNNGSWRISGRFGFGDAQVEVSSLFVSHRVPLAWARAMAMEHASERFMGGSFVPPTTWTVNLPANYWDL